MANICKPALKAVIQNKRKWLIRLHQKVLEAGLAFSDCAVVTHMLPGRKQVSNPTSFYKRNVEISYRSLRGQQAARLAHGGAGEGMRMKRRPFCNRMDRDCNIIPRESGQTSSWSLVTREWVESS